METNELKQQLQIELEKKNFVRIIQPNRGTIRSLCKIYYNSKEDPNQVTFEGGMILSMGQILSIYSILAGIAIVLWSNRPLTGASNRLA